MTEPLQDPGDSPGGFFDALIRSAERAFASGALTAALPWQTEWEPRDWTAPQVRAARVLARSPRHDALGLESVQERESRRGPDAAEGAPDTSAEVRAAWSAPLAALLEEVRPPLVHGPPDFQLTTEITNYACWVTVLAVRPGTERVGVLTAEGMGDAWVPYPVPVCLLDRTRLLPATAAALAQIEGWWPEDLGGVSAGCTHTVHDLCRILLAARLGESVWTMGAELERAADAEAGLDLREIAAVLRLGSTHHRLAMAHPVGGATDPETGALPGQVGWLCSFSGTPSFALCLRCGLSGRSSGAGRAWSRPLLIDEIRPQPQRCARCDMVMAHGVLETLPERYPRPHSPREGGRGG